MSNHAIEYYGNKYAGNKEKAFIHLAREVGELAAGIERSNDEMAKMELTETAALCFYLAKLYNLDLMQNMEQLYRKKLEAQKDGK